MNNASKFLFSFFIFLFLVAHVSALNVPAPDGFVRDDAHILTGYETQLEQRLAQLEKDTTVEIAILTVPSLEGEDASQYAGNVFDTWKIGQADVDNGLLILVATGDREYFFQTGYGLEGTLPDIALGRMGRDVLVPYFRDEEYGAGINAVVTEMESYIRKDPSVVSKYDEKPFEFELFGMGFVIIGIWILLFFLTVGKAFISMHEEKDRNMLTLKHAISLLFGVGWMAIVIGFFTYFITGAFYGFTLTCGWWILFILFKKFPMFNSTDNVSWASSLSGIGRRRGDGFGGSFGGGGFGGGMSGGGGAGGKW